MPVQVIITQAEVEAAQAAEIGEVRGRALTYDPRETMALCDKIAGTGHEGAQRLVTRLADIYGKNFLKPRTPAPKRVPSPAAVIRGPVCATGPIPAVVKAKPKRRRKAPDPTAA